MGPIKEIIGPGSVDSLIRLIFANAVYFKANWVYQFDPQWTKDDAFYLLNGSSIQVPFMTRGGGREYIGVFDGFKVLSLPYVNLDLDFDRTRGFSMYFYLPDDRQGLPALVEKAGFESGFIDGHLPREPVLLGRLRIPKFKIGFGFDVYKVLKEQGVVFEAGEDLFVSRVLHKSFIEVDEHGTEAAAVTVDGSDGCDLSDGNEVFVADHPFMFVTREYVSGAVLFLGQLLDPLAG